MPDLIEAKTYRCNALSSLAAVIIVYGMQAAKVLLVPWNICGAYMARTRGVATLAYLPFVFSNLVNPLISMVYGFIDFSVVKLDDGADLDDVADSATVVLAFRMDS